MKKFFTLIAVALTAMSVSAKEQVDISALGEAGKTITFNSWEWKTVKTYPTKNPVENQETKTADDSEVDYYDASAYAYLCIKYKQNTVATSFILQEKCKGTIGQWGTEYNEDRATLTANTSGMVGIKMSDAAHIFSIALQSQGEGSMIVEEIYFATEDEYKADAEANPVKKYVAPTKELSIATATGGWGEKSLDTTTGEGKIIAANAAAGWWLTGDFSDYGKVVVELHNVAISGYFQLGAFGQNFALENGSNIKVFDISTLDRTNASGSNFVFQGGEGTTFTVKKVYFATDEYVTENNIKDQKIYGDVEELSLATLSGGWDAEYDATTKTITITGEGGGGKGWWFESADYSHFDNFVVEFEEATTTGGSVVAQYAADGAESSSVEFYKGATCIVVALAAANKAAIKQTWIQGAKDAKYKLKKAYFAVASATPEANLGTPTAISTVKAAAQQEGVRYNLAGQKVNDSYKGVVIMNGKKVVIK